MRGVLAIAGPGMAVCGFGERVPVSITCPELSSPHRAVVL